MVRAHWWGGIAAVGFAGVAVGQTHALVETVQPRDCLRVQIATTVSGELSLPQGAEDRKVKVSAQAKHQFTERVLAADGGIATKVARHYATAALAQTCDGQPAQRSLRAERAVVVVQRPPLGAALAYSPRGPLTRGEYELVAEQFDTLALAGLLPGKAVAVGETWPVSREATQSLALFDGLLETTLSGKLKEAAGGVAVFAVAGTAKGIENGAQVTLTVEAEGRFDLAAKRLVKLTWKQSDDRSAGPVSPAATATATVDLTRAAVEEPKELTDAALESVPPGFEPPAVAVRVQTADPQGRFTVLHAPEWVPTGVDSDHTVLRLMDRGNMVAQATVTPWAKAAAGQHLSVEEFKKAVLEAPGWQPANLLQDGEVAGQPAGRYVYRVSADGQLEGAKVVQTFYLIAAPSGEQAIVAFTLKQEQNKPLGAKDVAFVEGVTVGK